MVIKVKKGMIKKDIDNLLGQSVRLKKRKVKLKKYCGVLKLTEDPLTTQKKLRNEWE